MARAPRVVIPGHPVHVIQRGNNRTPTFLDARDFERYRETLHDASRRAACAIHAYVLMTNHVHLLVTPEDDRGPSRLMQNIGRRYVRYVNARHGRTGTLWEGRFRASLIDSERYFLTCSRYIELNPVRAHIVEDPRAYRWSSHHANAHGDDDPLITPHRLYYALGSSAVERQMAYRGLFQVPFEPRTVNAIRRAANSGGVLGRDDFCEQVEITVHRPVRRMPHGGNRRGASFRSAGL